MTAPSLPPEVAERLGPYYVYALIDPRDDSIFYVGKGTGLRLLSHGQEALLKADPGPGLARSPAFERSERLVANLASTWFVTALTRKRPSASRAH